jgi:hypothetical protein
MQWHRLWSIGNIPLGELTLMDLACLAGLFYLAHLMVRGVLALIDDWQRRRSVILAVS